MIKADQIDEWLKEVEERPSSAPLIIRYISNRLRDLTSRNEELLKENIALRSEKRVEEYEARIAQLEYQLEMLKRQVGSLGEITMPIEAASTLSLILYKRQGQVLRIEVERESVKHGEQMAQAELDDNQPGLAPRLLVTSPLEELLFVFDSGRTVSMPAGELPTCAPNEVDWKTSRLIEPRGGEELVVVLPIGKMALYDYCVQSSRRGCARKLMRSSFESHVAKGFIGAGVKQKPDRTGGLVLCGKDDVFVMASREGYLVRQEVNGLPFTAEVMLRLSPTDHITSSFVFGGKPSLVAVTQNGKVLVREVSWLEQPVSAKTRGQPIFSQSRRDAGVRLAGAAAVDQGDWGAALLIDGQMIAYDVTEAMAAGALVGDYQDNSILEFVPFQSGLMGKE